MSADIPRLPPDQVALLATVDRTGPVVIPVSALLRTSPRTLLMALARSRASLTRAELDPRGAISLSGPRFSVCARGRLQVVANPLPGAPFVAALRFTAETVWDARGPATEVEAGIVWRWTEADAAERHAQVLAALRSLTNRR